MSEIRPDSPAPVPVWRWRRLRPDRLALEIYGPPGSAAELKRAVPGSWRKTGRSVLVARPARLLAAAQRLQVEPMALVKDYCALVGRGKRGQKVLWGDFAAIRSLVAAIVEWTA